MADRLIMQTRDACSLLGMLLLQGLLCRKGDKSLRGESLSKRQQQWEIPHAITKLKIDHPSSLKIDISRQKKSRRKAWLLRGVVKQKGTSEIWAGCAGVNWLLWDPAPASLDFCLCPEGGLGLQWQDCPCEDLKCCEDEYFFLPPFSPSLPPC